MLHAATLIHDDLVDSSPLRRGQETLHTIWPVGATELAGDYLLGEATALGAELDSPRIAREFAGILRTMWAGEIRRMLAIRRGRGASSPEGADHRRQEYFHDIQAKTSSLIAATMEMGAILADAEERHIETLRRYGKGLGIAYQIVDDVLEFAADERSLGKPVGSDLRRGLPTVPVLCLLPGDDRRRRACWRCTIRAVGRDACSGCAGSNPRVRRSMPRYAKPASMPGVVRRH
jgi:geranylgeranyl pyrophosphate synthase